MTTTTPEQEQPTRRDPWNQLGVPITYDGATAEETLQIAGLADWNVREANLNAEDNGTNLAVLGRRAIVRDEPSTGTPQVLDTVGKVYKPVQNEAHASVLDAVARELGAEFEVAGNMKGGRVVFITMRLPSSDMVGGDDQVDHYLTSLNSHDGSTAFTFLISPVRLTCANMINFAMANAQRYCKFRHTAQLHGEGGALAQRQVDEVLGMTSGYLNTFGKEAKRLADKDVSDKQFQATLEREFGAAVDAPQATITRREGHIDEMVRLFREASSNAGIRNTAWAAVNAVSEWADHYAPTRGSLAGADARAVKAALDPAMKDRAYRMFA